MADLRETRHRETSDALVEAAFELFASDGFSQVTMSQIAAAAGVSRSTAYRRFTNKEALVLEVPRRWLGAWDEVMAGFGTVDQEPGRLADAMAAGCRAVSETIDADRTKVLLAYAAMAESPTLESSGAASREWIDRMVSLIDQCRPTSTLFEQRILAGACMGAIDLMMFHWVESGGSHSVAEATDQVMAQLRPLFAGSS